MVKIRCRNDLILQLEGETPEERTKTLRKIRMHRLLSILRQEGALSRRNLAQRAGFNFRSTCLLIQDLVNTDLIVEHSNGNGATVRRGRGAAPVRFNSNAGMIIGIGVTEENTVATATDLNSKQLAEITLPTASVDNEIEFQTFVESLMEGILAAVAQKNIEAPPLAGIGISLPWKADKPHTYSRLNGNGGHSTLEARLCSALRLRYAVPITTCSHTHALTSAYQVFGPSDSLSSFVYINLGQNPAVGTVIDGKIHYGSSGLAGQIERMRTVPGDDSRFADDQEALAELIGLILSLQNPDAIVLGGDSMISDKAFGAQLQEKLTEKNLLPALHQTPIKMDASSLEGPALGALAIVFSQMFTASHIPLEAVL